MAETFIYVIGAQRGPKKIGIATDIKNRLRQFQTAYHRPLSVMLTIQIPTELAVDIERRAHWLLRDSRASGEWFTVSARDAISAVKQAATERGVGEKARSSAGRPALNIKPMLVRLPVGTAERIDEIVGPNRRAEFIREAIEREIKRRIKAAKG